MNSDQNHLDGDKNPAEEAIKEYEEHPYSQCFREEVMATWFKDQNEQQRKADLKTIQEKTGVDPASVIEQMTKLGFKSPENLLCIKRESTAQPPDDDTGTTTITGEEQQQITYGHDHNVQKIHYRNGFTVTITRSPTDSDKSLDYGIDNSQKYSDDKHFIGNSNCTYKEFYDKAEQQWVTVKSLAFDIENPHRHSDDKHFICSSDGTYKEYNDKAEEQWVTVTQVELIRDTGRWQITGKILGLSGTTIIEPDGSKH